jgi:hypothetical protein
VQWGDKAIIAERLGNSVRDVAFETGIMLTAALSPQHFRAFSEKTAGPVIRLVESLEKNDPAKLAEFRREYDALAAQYFQDNVLQQGYLMTRALKN